jgi:hypothetical protein
MQLFGNYRARVVMSKDPELCGRVQVWVPDLMEGLGDDSAIWALPANNPVGGRNDTPIEDGHFMGTCYIPPKGSWVWVFFEAGNINRPFYFGALDLKNTKVLPENQAGLNPEQKWTIFKSHEGRCVVVSDDASDCRVEITGKKRKLIDDGVPPTGGTGAVYQIDDNQTTILLDERDGREQLLIRTHNGDFLDINITTRTLRAFFKGGITIGTDGIMYLDATKINMTSLTDININPTLNLNLKAGAAARLDGNLTASVKGADVRIGGSSMTSIKSGGPLALDGTVTLIQQGTAQAPGGAAEGDKKEPVGDRDSLEQSLGLG